MAEHPEMQGAVRRLQDGNVLEIGSTGTLRTYGNVRLGSSGSTGSTGTIVATANLTASGTATFSGTFTASGQVRQTAIETVTSTIYSTGGANSLWSALASYGRSDLDASCSTGGGLVMGFKLGHPGVAGVRKRICLVNGSTAKPAYVELTSTNNWIGGTTGSTGAKNHRLAFDNVNDAVELESGSSVAWRLISNNGSVALSTNFTT